MAIFKITIRLAWTLSVALALVSGASLISLARPQSQGDGSRQIVLDEFTKARPTPTPTQTKRPATAANRKRPTYRRVGGTLTFTATTSTRPATTEELGITLWRLRQSRQND